MDYTAQLTTKDNLDASAVVDLNMTEYALDVAENKVPNVIDGLKKIHRRALWIMRSHLNNKNLIMNKYLGELNELHQVGDISIINACLRMAQEHSVYTPLLNSEGNTGRYETKSKGAPRYLHIEISDIAEDLFYTGVNLRTLPMIETMDFMSTEPAYFIPRLPTTLLFEALTIGVGTKTQILPLVFSNVCNLVKLYLDEKEKNPFKIPQFKGHEKLLIPDTPIYNVIRNTKQLLAAYENEQYNAAIYVDGEIDIYPNKLIIRTIPYTIPFGNVTDLLLEEIRKKSSWLNENCVEITNLANEKTKGALSLIFKKSVNIFDALEKVKSLISFSLGIKPIHNYVNRYGYEVKATPPLLIDRWYKERYNSLIGGIKYDQSVNIKQIYERETRLLVADHSEEIIDILKADMSNDDIASCLMEQYELSKNQANILLNTPIKILNKTNKEVIIKEIEQLRVKADNLRSMLLNVNDVIYQDAEYLQKKYKKPRVSKINPYIGYIHYNNKHIIQFDSIDECLELLSKFPTSTVKFFCGEMNYRYLVPLESNTFKVRENKFDAPKITNGKSIIEAYSDEIYTLCIKEDTVSCIKGMFYNDDSEANLIPITKNFTGIDKFGVISKMSINDVAIRKKLDARGKFSDLLYAVPSFYKNFILVHMNPISPDTIRFDRIKANETKKILFMGDNNETVLGIIPINNTKNEFIFNLPDYCIGNYKFLYITNFKKIQNNRDNFVCTVAKRSRRNDTVRNMIEL